MSGRRGHGRRADGRHRRLRAGRLRGHLHATGHRIARGDRRRKRLRPLAGDLGVGLSSAAGLAGAACSPPLTVPLSTAYSVAEAFGRESVSTIRVAEARLFYLHLSRPSGDRRRRRPHPRHLPGTDPVRDPGAQRGPPGPAAFLHVRLSAGSRGDGEHVAAGWHRPPPPSRRSPSPGASSRRCPSRSSKSPSSIERLDELEVARQPGGAEELRADPLAGPPRRARCARSGSSSSPRRQPPPKASRSRGSSSSTPVSPSTIWSWIPPTRLATTGRALPHRLGDGQAEALGEALLHDDVAWRWSALTIAAFSSSVVHRQAGEVDARARLGASASRCAARPRRAPRRPRGRRTTAPTAGPASTQVRVRPRGSVLGEAAHHAERVLEPVPARDLADDAVVAAAAARPRSSSARPVDPRRAAVVARERRLGRRRSPSTIPAAARIADDAAGLELLVLRRERVDRRAR